MLLVLQVDSKLSYGELERNYPSFDPISLLGEKQPKLIYLLGSPRDTFLVVCCIIIIKNRLKI